MTVVIAIILGIIQGLTEFLPISSTAHLTIAGNLFGLIDMNNPEKWTAFIAVTQLGTLLAVIVYFYSDIKNIIVDFFKCNLTKERKALNEQSLYSRMGWLIIIGTIPIVVLGLLLREIIEGRLTKDLIVIALSLVLLALVLAYAERVAKLRRDMNDVGVVDALIIGFAQALALIPGASRSGTSITAGLFLGLKRDVSARFSFLLSIPAVFASGIYEFYRALDYLEAFEFWNLLISVISSAVVGYLSIAFLLRFLKENSTMVFVYYRLVLGLLILSVILMGCSSPTYIVTKDAKGKTVVVGKLDWEEFKVVSGWNFENTLKYEGDKFIINLARGFDIKHKPVYLIFAGSWCPDSEQELPKLYKVLEEIGVEKDRIRLHGVDREKREQFGVAEKSKIERVPTLIIISGQKEAGRIVEFPVQSWEMDIYKILLSIED